MFAKKSVMLAYLLRTSIYDITFLSFVTAMMRTAIVDDLFVASRWHLHCLLLVLLGILESCYTTLTHRGPWVKHSMCWMHGWCLVFVSCKKGLFLVVMFTTVRGQGARVAGCVETIMESWWHSRGIRNTFNGHSNLQLQPHRTECVCIVMHKLLDDISIQLLVLVPLTEKHWCQTLNSWPMAANQIAG